MLESLAFFISVCGIIHKLTKYGERILEFVRINDWNLPLKFLLK